MRMTMDSGGGKAPVTIAVKLLGVGKKVRQEITGMGMPPVATIMNLNDSTMTVVMEQMGMAMIMRIPASISAMTAGGTHTNIKTSRSDLGPGEAINGNPTTRHRISISSTVAQSLGAISCTRAQSQEVEAWIASDPVLPKVMTEFTASMPKMANATEDPREMLRMAGLDPTKQAVVRTVIRDVDATPGKVGVTMTVEFSDYAILDVDDAKLTAPASMQVQDMRSMDMSAMMGGAMGQVTDKLFWANFDTTATAGAARATCTRK
jgi:hypothetical protein